MAIDIRSLVFVGFNANVAALHTPSGRTEWTWRAPKYSRGFVTLLLLNDKQLIASVDGYTYCLDPATGHLRWSNDLPGLGTGVASLAALGCNNPNAVLAQAAAAADDENSVTPGQPFMA
jgi:outer membrane protein assembly factor BamB